MPVIVEDSERANLLELILASLLQRKLTSIDARSHAGSITGPVEIQAGEMHATLTFVADDVLISRRHGVHAEARIRGSLSAILDAALGRRSLAHVLHRRLRVEGSARVLWHLIALLRTGAPR